MSDWNAPGQPGSWTPPPKKPWYQRKGIVIPLGVVAVLIVIGIAAGGSSEKKVDTTAPTVTAAAPTTPTTAIASSSANRDHPPQEDVKITECTPPDILRLVHAKGTITNSTAKPSNYVIHVAMLSGNVRVAEGYAAANEVQAGQVALFDAPGSVPEGQGQVACQVTSVERYASR